MVYRATKTRGSYFNLRLIKIGIRKYSCDIEFMEMVFVIDVSRFGSNQLESRSALANTVLQAKGPDDWRADQRSRTYDIQ
jgi:hypothetical protein